MYRVVYRTSGVELTSAEKVPEPRPGSILAKKLGAVTTALLLAGAGTVWARGSAKPHDTAIVLSRPYLTIPPPPTTKSKPAPSHSAPTTRETTTTKPKPSTTIAKAIVRQTTSRPVSTTKPTAAPSVVHAAAIAPAVTYGVDDSWPKGNCTAPASALAKAAFEIVDANHGLSFTYNLDQYPYTANNKPTDQSCFVHETSAASKRLEFYVNTNAPTNPGDLHFALNGPETCSNMTTTPSACGYNYGYNAGVADINFIMEYAPKSALQNWDDVLYMDVENCGYPCWTGNINTNVATLQGQVDGLNVGFKKYGHLTVGFYANKHEWSSITGDSYPDPPNTRLIWIATGPGTPATANDPTYGWRSRLFDNGIPTYAQYVGSSPVDDGAGRTLCYDLPLK